MAIPFTGSLRAIKIVHTIAWAFFAAQTKANPLKYPAKPTVVLLTSVIWDAQLHYRQRAFKSQVEWVLQTVRHFAGRSDIQLAIRVHPAEERGSLPSRQPIADEIEAVFPQLPPNVRQWTGSYRDTNFDWCKLGQNCISKK